MGVFVILSCLEAIQRSTIFTETVMWWDYLQIQSWDGITFCYLTDGWSCNAENEWGGGEVGRHWMPLNHCKTKQYLKINQAFKFAWGNNFFFSRKRLQYCNKNNWFRRQKYWSSHFWNASSRILTVGRHFWKLREMPTLQPNYTYSGWLHQLHSLFFLFFFFHFIQFYTKYSSHIYFADEEGTIEHWTHQSI